MAPKNTVNNDRIALTDEFFRDRKDWTRWSNALMWVLRTNNAGRHANMGNLTKDGSPPALTPPHQHVDPIYFLGSTKANLTQLPAAADGTVPARTSCTEEEFYQVSSPQEKQAFEAMITNHANRERNYRREEANINKVIKWISSHVERTIYAGVDSGASLHDIVSHLYRYAAVDKQYEKDEAIKEYDSVLSQAGRSIGQEAWFASWTAAYNTVKLVAPEEVAGIRGIRHFLDAASNYNAGYCAIAAMKAEEDYYGGKKLKDILHYAETVLE
ncbi:hypothetical protein OQA88_10785 [Cercophora sp. LCS_1]